MKKGFTLIEIMITISILIVISVMSFKIFYSYSDKYRLEKVIGGTVSLLERARNLSINSHSGERHGIYFTSTSSNLFEGSNFDSGNIILTKEYDSRVSLATSSFLTSSTTVIFKKITGEIDTYGFLTFKIINNPNSSSTIQIDKTGIIKK